MSPRHTLIVSFQFAMMICLVNPRSRSTDSYSPGKDSKHNQVCTGSHISSRSGENVVNAVNISFNLHDLKSPAMCLKPIILECAMWSSFKEMSCCHGELSNHSVG